MRRDPEQSRRWLAIFCLLPVTLLAYANSFQCGFVFDNRLLLLGNRRIQKATPENLALIFNHSYWWPIGEAGLYRPLTTLSFLFNYAILGNAENPAGYHWVNFLMHAGNVLLVFALARRLVREFWPSFLIAAVWAVHPVLTESVTNIVGRADLLAGMTTLSGLLMYLKAMETQGRGRFLWLAGLAAVTLVGVFSKESAVAVLGIVVLYEFTWRDRRRVQGLLQGCLAMLPAFLALWWMRSRVMAQSAPASFPFVDNPITGADFLTGRLTALKVLAKYVGLLVWPAHLSADYSYRQIPLATGTPSDWIAWILMGAIVFGVTLLYRRNKAAFFAAGLALITVLPASNLVVPVGAIMAERFLYLPAAGFAICLVPAIYAAARRLGLSSRFPLAAGLLIVSGFGARTWARNRDWRDELTFWSIAVQTSPLSFKTHTILAETLHAEHRDPDQAIREDEQSLALLSSLPDRLSDPGVYLRLAAEYTEKADALRSQPPNAQVRIPAERVSLYERARTLLFRRLAILREIRRAERTASPVLPGERGDPRLLDHAAEMFTYLMLSATDQQEGLIDESILSARQAQAAGPMSTFVYLRLHELLTAAGRREEARSAVMEGLLLTSDPELEKALLADYATTPDRNQCAISYAAVMPEIDFSCASVRRLACEVSEAALQSARNAGLPDVEMRLKRDFRVKYACDSRH